MHLWQEYCRSEPYQGACDLIYPITSVNPDYILKWYLSGFSIVKFFFRL